MWGHLKIFEKIINHKINTITGKELLKYGKQFQISLSGEQANKIAGYLRGKNFNIFNEAERARIIGEIAKITSPETAKEINRVFMGFVK